MVRRSRLQTWPAVLALAVLALAGAPAPAQEREALPLVVRPRATEGSVSEEARARQERLLRRMQDADYLFRNICRNCGGAIEGAGAYDPFDPLARLNAGRAPAPRRPVEPAPEPAEPAPDPAPPQP